MIDFAWHFFMVAFAIGFGLNLGGLLTWVERKQSAIMQDRIGANRADIFGFRLIGLFHPIADAIKMVTKEDWLPPRGMPLFHLLAPAISLGFTLLTLAALPFGDHIVIGSYDLSLQPIPLNAGVVFVLAMLSVGVHGVVMAGYASGNNYSLLGGLRGAAQMISYEVTLALTILGALFIYGTLDLQQAVRWQSEHVWGIVVQPLAFFLFLTAGVAESKRIPFDLPEGESEIVGYFIEYSGMKFGMFMFNDFVETILLSALTTTLFLGGWDVPFLSGLNLPLSLSALIGVAAFIIKTCVIIFVLMTVRWTLPRFRFDQLLDLGWKRLLPLSLLNFTVTIWVVYLFL